MNERRTIALAERVYAALGEGYYNQMRDVLAGPGALSKKEWVQRTRQTFSALLRSNAMTDAALCAQMQSWVAGEAPRTKRNKRHHMTRLGDAQRPWPLELLIWILCIIIPPFGVCWLVAQYVAHRINNR